MDASILFPPDPSSADENGVPHAVEIPIRLTLVSSERVTKNGRAGLRITYNTDIQLMSGNNSAVLFFPDREDGLARPDEERVVKALEWVLRQEIRAAISQMIEQRRAVTAFSQTAQEPPLTRLQSFFRARREDVRTRRMWVAPGMTPEEASRDAFDLAFGVAERVTKAAAESEAQHPATSITETVGPFHRDIDG